MVPSAASVGTDADDIEAIQTYVGNASSQVAATVAACAGLDEVTRLQWYALAGRIRAFVGETPALFFNADQLARGRALRDELNAFMATLKSKGCGDVAAAVAKAGPPHPAPEPPHGTLADALFSGINPTLTLVLGVGVLLLVVSRRG
ncbi:MAG TPA: hypothetical protein VFE26_10885 [Trebonia sp.]|jgi:hypothetical protein|nr:hypothetical protein [Trebonia sp.]